MSCPALTLDGSDGLAHVLSGIDCRTGEATAHAFGRLFGENGALLTALTILLTLYVGVFAIGLLTGRTRIGVAALTPRMLTLGLALTFATSWMAYQNVVWTLATGAPDQIATVIAGTHGSATTAFANQLDRIFNAIADAAQQAPQPAPGAAVTPGGAAAAPAAPTPGPGFFSPTNMLWLSGLMLLVGTVGVFVTAKIALAALLALGPVFIVMALFSGTRGLFEGWLKGVVLFALVPLFTVVIGGGTLSVISPLIQAAILDTGETATRAVTVLFLASCVYVALMVMVLKVASTIVAGWRLPGSRTDAVGEAAAPAAHTVAVPPLAEPARAAAGIADERVRAMVRGLPAAANDAAPAALLTDDSGPRARRAIAMITPGETAPAAGRPADRRIDGVGSRFRAPPGSYPKDRLS